jgi:hypothetical protein
MLLKFASAALVSAVLVSSVPAIADQNANAQPRAQRGTTDPQKKICREDNIQTGSIMPKRTCKTQAEWDALSARSQSNLDDLRDQNKSRDMVGGNR